MAAVCPTDQNWNNGSTDVRFFVCRIDRHLVLLVSSQAHIDAFAAQQPGLESNLKNLSQGITKYLEKHTEVYERDIQRVSELFSKVHQAVHVDTTTPGKSFAFAQRIHIPFFLGNKDLSSSIMKISGSYSGIADLYKTKVRANRSSRAVLPWLFSCRQVKVFVILTSVCKNTSVCSVAFHPSSVFKR